jgi:hypothetical protein
LRSTTPSNGAGTGSRAVMGLGENAKGGARMIPPDVGLGVEHCSRWWAAEMQQRCKKVAAAQALIAEGGKQCGALICTKGNNEWWGMLLAG